MIIEYGPPGAAGVKQLAYVGDDWAEGGFAPRQALASASIGVGVFLLTKKQTYGAVAALAAWFLFKRK